MKRFFKEMFSPKGAKFSFERLNYLNNQMKKNDVVDEHNTDVVIEVLRQISEIMIWGDQHNEKYFEYFLEHNMLGYFVGVLRQSVPNIVKVQLLQTLSIMIQNLKNEVSLFFLFSNNRINDLISYEFDFDDEEILAYYITFLKLLALKLNKRTVHFFFNLEKDEFPLYEEAFKFLNHRETMIRTSVRTAVLSILKVDVDSVRKYILKPGSPPLFTSQVTYIREQLVATNSSLSEGAKSNQKDPLSYPLESHLDHVYFLGDMLTLHIPEVSRMLVDRLLDLLIVPCLLESLDSSSTSSFKICPAVSLTFVGHVLQVCEAKRLSNGICALLLLDPIQVRRDYPGFSEHCSPNDFAAGEVIASANDGDLDDGSTDGASAGSGKQATPSPGMKNHYRSAFVHMLKSPNDVCSLTACFVLKAILSSPSVSPELLQVCGFHMAVESSAPGTQKCPLTSSTVRESCTLVLKKLATGRCVRERRWSNASAEGGVQQAIQLLLEVTGGSAPIRVRFQTGDSDGSPEAGSLLVVLVRRACGSNIQPLLLELCLHTVELLLKHASAEQRQWCEEYLRRCSKRDLATVVENLHVAKASDDSMFEFIVHLRSLVMGRTQRKVTIDDIVSLSSASFYGSDALERAADCSTSNILTDACEDFLDRVRFLSKLRLGAPPADKWPWDQAGSTNARLNPGDVVDMSLFEAFGCLASVAHSARFERYVVVDDFVVMLCEPHTHFLGKGIVRNTFNLFDLKVAVVGKDSPPTTLQVAATLCNGSWERIWEHGKRRKEVHVELLFFNSLHCELTMTSIQKKRRALLSAFLSKVVSSMEVLCS